MKDKDIVRDAVAEFLNKGFNYGDLVSHEWLDYELKIPYTETAVEKEQRDFTKLRRIKAFRQEILETHNIVLENVKGEGYKLIHPNDQAAHAVTEALRQAQNGMRYGSKVLKHARLDEMEPENRKRHIDADRKMAALSGMLSKERRDVFLPFKGES